MSLRPPLQARTASSSSFAEAFDAARHHLDREFDQEQLDELDSEDVTPLEEPCLESPGSETDGTSTPATPASLATTGVVTPALDPDVAEDFAFAFDIDGVLIRGGRPIPEAIEAMKVLNGDNAYGVKVPYIFVTNGGGKFETERCLDLTRQLQIEVSPGQFICGHTPMRQFAEKYGTVLVVGGEGEKCRLVAESYGFRDVITPGDILKTNAATAPFRKLTEQEHADSRDLRERGPLSNVVIDAIFVFADSRDWASDVQIIIDIAMSKGGRLETRSETFEEGPPIYFSHNDIVWAASHEHVRLGMGALRRFVEIGFSDVTGGKKPKTHSFGKPQVSTFEFATRLLQKWRAERHGLVTSAPPETVYFVGDTPESDIRGTNAMNASSDNDWHSILVKTGVYQDGAEPAYKPRQTVGTVLDAVHYGIEREMARRTAQGRPVGALSLDKLAGLALHEGAEPVVVHQE